MRLVSFRQDGRTSFGLVEDSGVIDAGRRLGGRFAGLRDVLLADALDEVGELAGSPPDHRLDDLAEQGDMCGACRTTPLSRVSMLPAIVVSSSSSVTNSRLFVPQLLG
jgi:hypothetical protein